MIWRVQREKKKLSFIHYLIWGLRNKNGWKVGCFYEENEKR